MPTSLTPLIVEGHPLEAHRWVLCLGTAHVLGDFLFQSDSAARNKHRLGVLFRHALMVAVLSYLLCGAWRSWYIPVAVFAAHALIDAVKARISRKNLVPFLLDQLAHLASIALIALAVAQQDPSLFGVHQFGDLYLKTLIVVAGVVLALPAGGVLISRAASDS